MVIGKHDNIASPEELQMKKSMALDNYAFYGSRKYFLLIIIALPVFLFLFYDQALGRYDAAYYEFMWPIVIYTSVCILVILFSFIRLAIWAFIRNDIIFIKRYSEQSRINIEVFKGKMQQIVYIIIVMVGVNMTEIYNFILSGTSSSRGLALLVADVYLIFLALIYLYRTIAWYLLRRRNKGE